MEAITIQIGDTGEIQGVDWEAWIRTEIETNACTRDGVALTYSYLLQTKGTNWNYREVNQLILKRWSPAALRYIKEKAWRLAA